jgi:diadenosine tetraphosphate (Ap4A) HIT family hydrolase
MHLIPRFSGDKFKVSFISSIERPKREVLDEISKKIKYKI